LLVPASAGISQKSESLLLQVHAFLVKTLARAQPAQVAHPDRQLDGRLGVVFPNGDGAEEVGFGIREAGHFTLGERKVVENGRHGAISGFSPFELFKLRAEQVDSLTVSTLPVKITCCLRLGAADRQDQKPLR
jgi:hypothetical protein